MTKKKTVDTGTDTLLLWFDGNPDLHDYNPEISDAIKRYRNHTQPSPAQPDRSHPAPTRQQTARYEITQPHRTAPTVTYREAPERSTTFTTMFLSAIGTILSNVAYNAMASALQRSGVKQRMRRRQSVGWMPRLVGYGCLVLVIVISLAVVGLTTLIMQPDTVIAWLINF